ncbi:MAG: hypothetical protein KH828_11295 [Clostridiales bacterium]|nr:hypothetical protein [Clostridiales bacterium]
MLKIRMQGTIEDIRWFQSRLMQDEKIAVLDISEAYKNKGTNRYVRVYAEVDKIRK